MSSLGRAVADGFARGAVETASAACFWKAAAGASSRVGTGTRRVSSMARGRDVAGASILGRAGDVAGEPGGRRICSMERTLEGRARSSPPMSESDGSLVDGPSGLSKSRPGLEENPGSPSMAEGPRVRPTRSGVEELKPGRPRGSERRGSFSRSSLRPDESRGRNDESAPPSGEFSPRSEESRFLGASGSRTPRARL